MSSIQVVPANFDIDALVGNIKGALGAEIRPVKDVEFWIRSGSPRFDLASGGGFPGARLTCLMGDKSIGKSSLGYKALAKTQQAGGIAAAQDVEHSIWYDRCLRMGLDLDRLILTQPETMDTYEEEEEQEVINEDGVSSWKKVKTKRLGFIDVIDYLLHALVKNSSPVKLTSLTDTISAASIESEMKADVGTATYGRASGVLAQGFRKIMGRVYRTNTTLIMINQLKDDVKTGGKTYMCKKPIDFHSSVTCEMTRVNIYPKPSGDRKEYGASLEKAEGVITECFFSKNKIYRPFTKCELTVFFDRGIDELFESVMCLNEQGRMGKSTGYYLWDGKNWRLKELLNTAEEKPELKAAIIQAADDLVDEITGRADKEEAARQLAEERAGRAIDVIKKTKTKKTTKPVPAKVESVVATTGDTEEFQEVTA